MIEIQPEIKIGMNFDRAAKRLTSAWRALSRQSNLPALDMSEWKGSHNCYNYASGVKMGPIVPGEIRIIKAFAGDDTSLDRQLKLFSMERERLMKASPREYVAATVKGAKDDGLEYLGETPQLNNKGVLTALFFSHHELDTHDFHWYVLGNVEGHTRWTNKFPNEHPAEVADNDIFSHARRNQYRFFGGYFLRPHEMGI